LEEITLNEWLPLKIGQDIFNKKYRYQDETLGEWFRRVSGGNKELEILMLEKKFLFGGRILANRGLQHKGKKIVYQNCFVVPSPEDNIESIFDTAKHMARIYSLGGGVGVSIDNLSPSGAKLNNAAEVTTGSVSFMDLYSLVTQLISSKGRRGALIITINDTHPDLIDFINVKNDLGKVTKANISVKITDEFMTAVTHNGNWELHFERPETKEKITKTVEARKILKLIAENSHKTGEPAILYWSKIQNNNFLKYNPYFVYGGVNPCGELPLPTGYSKNGHYIWGGSCNLGAMNISEYVYADDEGNFPYIDYDVLYYDTKIAFKALNEVLHESIELLPYNELKEAVNDWRLNGMGHMGIADALIKLGVMYGSELSFEIAENVQKTILNACVDASSEDVEKYGVFKYYDFKYFKSSPMFEHLNESVKEKVEKYGVSNGSFCTVAPTGSLSTMIGVSGGIEPIYEFSYIRKTESLHDQDTYYRIYTPIVEEFMKEFGLIDERELPKYFIKSKNINYMNRIQFQSSIQKYNDGAISSTINLPESATVEDIVDIYVEAWKHGLKGLTVFRENCERVGILTNEIKKDDEEDLNIGLPRGFIEEVPEDLFYRKYKLRSGCGNIYFFVGVDDFYEKIYDCFTNTDGVGGCMINTIANSRLLSAGLRGGIPIEYLIQQLEKSGVCPSYQNVRGKQTGALKIKNLVENYISDEILDSIDEYIGKPLSNGKSCASALAYVLKNIAKEFAGEAYEDIKYEVITKNDILKNEHYECKHENMKMVEGCTVCPDCGFSHCN